jgi:geranyl-CoA carboxylase alpha subunit
MLRRLLIANRGEIAVRVARSARRLGLATVAVYSDADAASPHVAACDDAVALGGEAATESYLRVDKLLAAARATRSDAIHPGYGFLSENPAFAQAALDAGLVFVGPPPAAIEAMGDKARARRRMAAAGIPVVAGYDGDAQEEARFRAEAARIGYPVMIKAAAGGGGRGMRIVAGEAELPDALRSAAQEAAKAFGDDRLILERALVAPRHVEIQVFADTHGNVLHLGERDCSVQRRHQKIVEEAPSPAVDADLRARMGATAVAVAREIGYVGAGTVEFLLDAEGRHWFMEMNTRLQVEHPVTELVTGLDLVELQLRVARGEPLPLRQGDVELRGHAIEARLCAESPADDFLPGGGPILDWQAPYGVRCDHAVATGGRVTAWYDSMLAKVIAHAPTRTEAVAALAGALDDTVLLGVPTNRAFVARLLRHPAFEQGRDVSTAFIARHYAAASSRAASPHARAFALAAWLSVAGAAESRRTPEAWRHFTTGRPLPHPWRLRWLAPGSLPAVELHGRLWLEGASCRVETGEARHAIAGDCVPPCTPGRAAVDGEPVAYRYAWDGATLWLHLAEGDYAFACRRREPARSARSEAATAAQVRATFNARVVEVRAVPGAEVRAGERLVVLEAMKMEHEVRAARDGRIAEVGVRAGDQVAPGQLLLRYEDAPP